MRYWNRLKFLVLAISLMGELTIYAQEEYGVTGKVFNSRNEPIEGISVSLEGKDTVPVITAADGSFSVFSRTRDYWLIFTPYEKYKTKKVLYSGSREVKVYLTDNDIESGSDVIPDIGQKKERKNIVSPTHTVDSRYFDFLPYQSVDQFFQGTVPGGLFINHSGMPGSGGPVFLRGQTSLNASNMPLIIVDGIPLESGTIYSSLVTGSNYDPLSVISPKDVSSISILRGAAASLYGVKGSNGVILVETLKPRDINTTIDFAFKAGINIKGKQLPQLNARQHKTLANEILTSSGMPEEWYPELVPGLFLTPGDEGYIRYSHDYNWQDEVFSNSVAKDAYFNIMGGDANGKYGLSVGYLDYDGIFRNTGFNRFTSRFVGLFNMFEWLRVSVSANLVKSTSELKESALSRSTSPVITSLAKTPMQFPYQYDEKGNQLTAIQDVDEMGISNPKAVMDFFKAKNTNTRFLTSFKIEGDINRNLKFNSLLALNINSLRQNAFYPDQGMESYYNLEVWNSSQDMTNNLFSLFNDNYFSYIRTFNNKHCLNIMAGLKWASNKFEEDYAIANNLNPNDQFVFLQAGVADLREIGGDIRNWNWFSGYTRIDYSFMDRYLFEINSSGDLSSNVGRESNHVFLINNVPYGMFYSGAFSWRLSKESFLSNITSLDDLRINLQYGLTGNHDIGTRNRQDYYRLLLYRETSGMIPAGYGNPALGYERSGFYSVGTDISLLGNRYRFSFEYHNTSISDMLIYESLSSYVGSDEFPSNNASMVNKGYEFNIFSRLIKTSQFILDLSFNLAKIENEITEIKSGEMITDLPGYSVINRTGDPANSFYGYIYEGVIISAKEAETANLVNGVGIPFRAGDAKFKDISGPDQMPDGVINDYDKVILGSGFPDIFGGMTVSFSYKNWNLQTLWQFVTGNEIFNYVRYQNERMIDLSNQSITTLRRWSYDGQETDMPKAKWDDPVGNSAFSTRWIEDGSYLRCRNIMLSYRVPGRFIVFRELIVYADVMNLFTFSKYLGYDPEFSYSYQPYIQGADYGLMPQSRRIMFGIKLGL